MKRKPSRRKEKPQPQVKEPFIADKNRKASQNDTGFFQPKLKIGNSSDPTEKEADKAADKVVNKQNNELSSNKSVQKQAEKEEPKAKLIQKQTEKEEPKAKLIQKQAEKEEPKAKLIQKQAEKEEPKAKLIQKQTEEEPKAKLIQKQEEKEKPEAKLIQKQAQEEEPKAKLIQKQDMPKEEVQKKKSSANQSNKVQKESKETGTSAKFSLEDMIKKTKGKGMQLPGDIRNELEVKLQADFSKVRIHSEGDAIKMAAGLKAQAFTHGYDIYFNKGKYNPYSKEGKHLLAHELSHVVQQKGHGK